MEREERELRRETDARKGNEAVELKWWMPFNQSL